MTKSLLIAAVLAASTSALAQPAPPAPTPSPAPAPGPTPTPAASPTPGSTAPDQPPPPPANPEDEKKAKAKAAYEKGLGHYNLGEFDLAIASFKEAYAISNAPGLLFNVAQSYRLKKDYEQASYFYTTYLRLKPEASNRADVEARLEEMEKLIEEQKRLQNSPPSGTVTPEGTNPHGEPEKVVATPVAPTPEGGLPPRTFMTMGIATGGAGVALLVTGAIFGSMASGAEGDLNDLNMSNGTWTQEAQDKYDAGKRNNTIAIVSYIVGGAAVATGGTFYVLGMLKKKRMSASLSPSASGTTASLSWAW